MAKTYYSDYVTHCLRFYAKYPKANPIDKIDKDNWIACHRALSDLSSDDRTLLISIYKEADTIADNVYQISKQKGIPQSRIWKLISNVERKVARYRELLY